MRSRNVVLASGIWPLCLKVSGTSIELGLLTVVSGQTISFFNRQRQKQEMKVFILQNPKVVRHPNPSSKLPQVKNHEMYNVTCSAPERAVQLMGYTTAETAR